jgi:hypothetical protein
VTAMPDTEWTARALIAMFLWCSSTQHTMAEPASGAWHNALVDAWNRALEDVVLLPPAEHYACALRRAATAVQESARSDRAEAQRLRAENVALRAQTRDVNEQLECARTVALYLDVQNAQLKECNRSMVNEAMLEVRERLRLLQRRSPAYADTAAVDDDCCCAVCMEILVLPVTNRCGHTLCAPCYTRLMNGTGVARACPMCRAPLHVADVAIQLRNLVESRYPGQVARRLDALMALRGDAGATLRDESPGASDNLC